jgi:hypothetical protein
MTPKPLYRQLALLVQARLNAGKSGNHEWFDQHTDAILQLVREHAPSGSGFDSGTKIDLQRSTGEKLVFDTAFHHMNENGFYTGWTKHTVTVRASLTNDIDLTISGRNLNEIKDCFYDVFFSALTRPVAHPHAQKAS